VKTISKGKDQIPLKILGAHFIVMFSFRCHILCAAIPFFLFHGHPTQIFCLLASPDNILKSEKGKMGVIKWMNQSNSAGE
jgi:hypothetical protein